MKDRNGNELNIGDYVKFYDSNSNKCICIVLLFRNSDILVRDIDSDYEISVYANQIELYK